MDGVLNYREGEFSHLLGELHSLKALLDWLEHLCCKAEKRAVILSSWKVECLLLLLKLNTAGIIFLKLI